MRKRALLVSTALLGLALPMYAGATETRKTDQGKQIFTQGAQPSCTICHTLADAGSTGAIGPNLDELKPSREQVINAVTGGVGIMPAFEESLTQDQIEAVADYLTTVTGKTE